MGGTRRLGLQAGIGRALASSLLLAIGCSGGKSGAGIESTSGSVAGRLHPVNLALAITPLDAGASPSFQTSGATSFTYVASVNAPVNPGTSDVLQATNFAFTNTHALVTYNMAGPATEGALDVVDLSDPTKAALVACLQFPAEEFADVAVSGGDAFLVGQGAAGGLLAVVDISDPAHPREIADLALGSYYATSIALEGTSAYITTGDTGGGLVRVDVTNPSAPAIKSIVPLSNALSAIRSEETTFVFGGDTATNLYSIATTSALSLATIGSERFAAPVRMALTNADVVTNGAHSGLSVLHASPTSATLVFHADLPGTGNGIDIAGNLGVLAQGEAGTLLYDFTTPTAPIFMGSFAFPDDRGSANEVRLGNCVANDYIFLSDGLGGFRIVRLGATADGGTRH
jgi:hypothetical protein